MRPKSFECDEGFFTLLSRSVILQLCEISLPQKASPACVLVRDYHLDYVQKVFWKLDTSPWGFERLHLSLDVYPPWLGFAIAAMIDPFRRLYFEDYLQTVILSNANKILYNHLFNGITMAEISQNYGINYKVLSKVFEWAADLGGVSMNYYFYAHCYFKR